MTSIDLLSLARGGLLRATPEHLEVVPPEASTASWTVSDVSEEALRLDLEALVEQGVVYPDAGVWRAKWPDLLDAVDAGLTPSLLELGEPNPYLLHIGSTAALGTKEFAFTCSWKNGTRSIDAESAGMFLWVEALKRLVRLDGHTARILLTIDRFNQLPLDARSQEEMLRSLELVQGECNQSCAYLVDALQGSRIVVPDQLGLRMEFDDGGRLTFIPTCDGVDDVSFRESFLRTKHRRPVYSFTDSTGEVVRIAFSPRQLDVLDRMRAVRQVAGVEAERLRVHPETAFDGLLDVLDLDFWERVTGIGAPPSTSVPATGPSESGFLNGSGEDAAGQMPGSVGRETDPKVDGHKSDHRPGTGSYLIVAPNEAVPFIPESTSTSMAHGEIGPQDAALPSALAGTPKQHQREAIAWLNRSRRLGRRGVLLADDMGLGKTFQVLTHLSSLIERTGLGESVDPVTQQLRWRPILIVAPLILLETETWQNDMRRFFVHEGEQFLPLLVLHGQGLEKARRSSGQDVRIGRPALDPDFLCSHRIVITNYETVVNYQLSLAQLRDGRPMWSTIVTDEAQEYKAPNTRISHALKAMDADFFVASTGTPVENRLLDLWNIVDTITPPLLGTSNHFTVRYEQPATVDAQSQALDELRQILRLGSDDAYVLRRTKEQILSTDLPKKEIKRLYADMSEAEVAAHQGLLHGLRESNVAKGRHLKVLQQLVSIYQHPLGQAVKNAPVEELLATSAKLRVVMEELRRIKALGEKVLIFARLRDIQVMLARVIKQEFGVHAPIINGATSSGKGRTGSSITSGRARESRQGILRSFEVDTGFGVCILSPFVAGMGLTITAANHVIHYGRWWNPAVEAQATDRVYRIGQERPVTVYLPVLRDASGVLQRSFDELLDAHLERKQALGDFLVPMPNEVDAADELMSDLLEETGSVDSGQPQMTLAEVRSMGSQMFEALVAELLALDGYQVCLTPLSWDGGADVIAAKGTELLLVQAKYSQVNGVVSETALMDLVAAQDYYGNQASVSGLRLMLATNSTVSGPTRETAERDGVDVWDSSTLTSVLRKAGVAMSQVVSRGETRCRGMHDVKAWLKGVGLSRD